MLYTILGGNMSYEQLNLLKEFIDSLSNKVDFYEEGIANLQSMRLFLNDHRKFKEKNVSEFLRKKSIYKGFIDMIDAYILNIYQKEMKVKRYDDYLFIT